MQGGELGIAFLNIWRLIDLVVVGIVIIAEAGGAVGDVVVEGLLNVEVWGLLTEIVVVLEVVEEAVLGVVVMEVIGGLLLRGVRV
jgi:hypothetical protein